MRVAIDTNCLYMTQAGVARYVRGLLAGFRELAPSDLELMELAWPVENFAYRQPTRALKTVYRELIWAKTLAPWMAASRGCDVIHSTSGPVIRIPKGKPHVITLYDLAFLRCPERFRWWQRRSGAARLQKVSEAECVICISRFTADEAMALLGIPAAKLEVVHLGCDFVDKGMSAEELVPLESLPERFFLFVGSLEPGKNLDLLKRTYSLARERGEDLAPLVILGARWQGVPGEGPPPEDWVYLGRQPDAVLVYLYRRAVALVFPSKYEGFGLPVAEAMTLGCPVICSPVASLPEVGGEAVLYAEQTADAYLEAMTSLMRDGPLRNDIIAKGRLRSGRFSWKSCAAGTLEIYRQLF